MKLREGFLVLGALVAVAGWAPAAADVPCPSFLPACGFSVTGKKGPYLKQVDPQKLVAGDAALKAPSTAGGKGLGEHSINEGQIAGASLYMPQTEAKLNRLLAIIRAQWPYADPGPIRVRMIARTTYGPKSQPDNTLLVPLGFLERAQSDDEVVWVLAHEFSHLALRHFVRTAELQERERGMDHLVDVFTTGLALTQVRADSSGQSVHFYAVSDPRVQQRTNSTEAWQDRVRTAFLLKDYVSSRDQEDQADATGADLAIGAGYAADDGAAQAIDQISQDDADAAKTTKSLQAEMQQIVLQSVTAKGAQALAAGNFQAGATDFVRNMVGNTASLLTDRTTKYLSETHRAGPARRKGLNTYMTAAYPNLPDRPLRTAWLKEVQATTEFKDAAAAVTSHDKAESDLENSDPVKAAQDLQAALGTSFANTPFVLNVEAETHNKTNDIAAADSLYDRAEAFGRAPALAKSALLAIPMATAKPASAKGARKKHAAPTAPSPAPPAAQAVLLPRQLPAYVQQSREGYQAHVDLLASHEQYAKAWTKITEAEQRFGDNETLLPQIIYVSLKTNRPEQMMVAFGECEDTEDEALILSCRRAILDDAQKRALDQLPPNQRDKVNHMLARSSSNVQRVNWWSQTTKAIATPTSPPAANP